jgi:hypothetical protein
MLFTTEVFVSSCVVVNVEVTIIFSTIFILLPKIHLAAFIITLVVFVLSYLIVVVGVD